MKKETLTLEEARYAVFSELDNTITLHPLNRLYYGELLARSMLGEGDEQIIGETFYPESYADRLPQIPGITDPAEHFRGLDDLKEDQTNIERAQQTRVIYHPMVGGLGTTVIMRDGKSKATDLMYPTDGLLGKQEISVAEALYLKANNIAKHVHELVLQPVASEKSYATMLRAGAILDNPSINHSVNIHLEIPFIQEFVPSRDTRTGKLTTERLHPAGHAQVFLMILADIIRNPSKDGVETVRVIGNSDLNDRPPTAVIGDRRSTMKVQVTLREPCDAKGGVMGFKKMSDGWKLDIQEEASVAPHQKAEFSSLGLTEGSKPQSFNTNVVQLYEPDLHAWGQAFINQYGWEELVKLTLPSVIKSEKQQNGITYEQVEGAMVSSMLNLAYNIQTDNRARAIWEQAVGTTPPIECIVVPREYFGPSAKSAMSYVLQRNRYQFNTQTGTLVDLGTGHLPLFQGDLANKRSPYASVEYAMKAFGGIDFKTLRRLNIIGEVNFSGFTGFSGEIDIVNKTRKPVVISAEDIQVALGDDHVKDRLKDVRILLEEDIISAMHI